MSESDGETAKKMLTWVMMFGPIRTRTCRNCEFDRVGMAFSISYLKNTSFVIYHGDIIIGVMSTRSFSIKAV